MILLCISSHGFDLDLTYLGCVGTEDGTKRMQIQGNDEHKGEEWIDVLGWSADKTITIGDDVSPPPDT